MAKKGRRGASPIASRFSKSETAATAPALAPPGAHVIPMGGADGFELQAEHDRPPTALRNAGDEPPAERGATLTLPMKPNGKINLAAMGPKKRDRLRSAIDDDAFRDQIAPVATAAPAPSMFTDGSLADLLFRAVDTMLVGALEKRGAPPELARIMAMTDDERAEIGPEVSARLDYWFGHYKVNADLLVAFKVGGLYWRKWNALTRAIQQWQASQGNAAAAPGAPTQ